jgi:hypothetical protein
LKVTFNIDNRIFGLPDAASHCHVLESIVKDRNPRPAAISWAKVTPFWALGAHRRGDSQ